MHLDHVLDHVFMGVHAFTLLPIFVIDLHSDLSAYGSLTPSPNCWGFFSIKITDFFSKLIPGAMW